MNRNEAKKLAETVTLEDLKQMFLNAQAGIKDWTETSRVNIGMTKGTAYNILSIKKEYANINEIHILARTNMIWEFGEFLPGYQKQRKKQKPSVNPVHEEPKF